jgi:proline iminopeptidase
MRTLLLLAAALPLTLSATPAGAAKPKQPPVLASAVPRDWFPVPEPFKEGMLQVSKLHAIHWQLSGNPEGWPVMVLHGGPGGGSYPSLRRYFDPARWLVVEHDQRGSGKSTPYGELRENTTADLVEDVERLRAHLGHEKVTILGGSWGATLALAYSEKYPQRVAALVLRGVFTCTRAEIDHFYHGGVEPFFPEAYAALRAVVPRPDTKDWPRQLLALTTSPDVATRERAVQAWAVYETRISAVGQTEEDVAAELEGWDPLSFSRIENHYMANGCFVEEGQLLRDLPRLAAIPTVIVQGRYDVICPPITAWRVHQRLPRSRLVMLENAGHSGGAPPMRRALVEAVRSIEHVAAADAGAKTREAGTTPTPTPTPIPAPARSAGPAAPLSRLEPAVAVPGRQLTGIAVSRKGRLFVNFPRWSDDVPVSVAEVKPDGSLRPYPDPSWNGWEPGADPARSFVCAQAAWADARDHLWVIDPASPKFGGVVPGGPKLVEIDLANDRVLRVIPFGPDLAPKASYLNDVRVDRAGRWAYLTDSGAGGLVVVDLRNGTARRVLGDHPSTRAEPITVMVEGRPWAGPDGKTPPVHSDGIALSPDGETLWYRALTGRTLYRIPTAALRNAALPPAELARAAQRVAHVPAGDGMEMDARGTLYLTDIEDDAVVRLAPDGALETVASGPELAWPDSLAIAADGALYVTASQIHRIPRAQGDVDRHEEPFRAFRIAQPRHPDARGGRP